MFLWAWSACSAFLLVYKSTKRSFFTTPISYSNYSTSRKLEAFKSTSAYDHLPICSSMCYRSAAALSGWGQHCLLWVSMLQTLKAVLFEELDSGAQVLLLTALRPTSVHRWRNASQVLWVNKHLQWQRCIKKKEHGSELHFARALVSLMLGGGLCCSFVQIAPSFYAFIHAYSFLYSFLVSLIKQLRISVCGMVLHCCEGKNSILCFVRTPTQYVRRWSMTQIPWRGQ